MPFKPHDTVTVLWDGVTVKGWVFDIHHRLVEVFIPESEVVGLDPITDYSVCRVDLSGFGRGVVRRYYDFEVQAFSEPTPRSFDPLW